MYFSGNKIRKKLKGIIDPVYLHPFLISIFPLLFFVNHNKDQLLENTRGMVMMLILILIFAFVVLGLNLLLLKNLSKASLNSFVSLIIFFFFGHIEAFLDELIPDFNINFSLSAFSPTREFIYFDIGITKILYFVFTVFLLITYLKVQKASKIPLNIHKALMLFSIILVLYNAVDLLIYRSSSGSDEKAIEVVTERIDIGEYPDIYYIIPDSYAGTDILEEVYDYDNSDFINFLEDQGFYIAEESFSNYAFTFLSLASSLNLEYINYLSTEEGEDSRDFSKPFKMQSENKLFNFLKNKGYKIINYSSGYGPTDRLAAADYNLEVYNLMKIGPLEIKPSEFSIEYFKTTAFFPLLKNILTENQRLQTLFVFKTLSRLEYIDSPKFVLAHIMSPHPPYVFDKYGNVPENADLDPTGDVFADREIYLDQLIFTTEKLKETVQNILLANDNCIIILQSDHGPAALLGSHAEHWDFSSYDNVGGIKERMSILNAYYFPDSDYSMLTNDISPVNTFRIVLNKYFAEDLELLENKVYISDYSSLYKFWDVTDLVKNDQK